MKSISAKELSIMLKDSESFTLLDVREPIEIEFASIGGKSIPLSELTYRVNELEKTASIVVLCHHGFRSSQAQAFLISQGFINVMNLDGGIDDWSNSVDPSVPKY